MTTSRLSTVELAQRITDGDRDAADLLMERLYRELRMAAQAAMNREQPGHTLQPTALVHDVFIRLSELNQMNWTDGAHVRAMAAELMRRVLIDHARKKQAAKRGGDWERITLTGLVAGPRETPIDLLELDDALNELDRLNSRHRQVVQLRFFGGLTHEQTATVLDISEQTARLDWSMARAWLRGRLESRSEKD